MRTPSSGIALEGLPCIGITAFSALIFALIGCPPMAVIFLALAFFSLHFFRDPERVTPAEAGIAVSPADGKVIKTMLAPDPFSGDMRPCVSIFMNVFNVHVNRSPVESTVTGIAYRPGKFINAALDKASADNERCAYKLEDADKNEWSMVQIAGLIARRIVCRAEQGDALERGERFGMIRFGSRVDLYLPEGYEPAVAPGDRTVAGETVVARKKA